ncbi:MAG: geranylgeranyl reductase family protein [Bacteroidota bacterium]
MIETPVCIVGAGPGGATAALKLDQLGIPCVLVDKATFPRDKVCGDALSGKVVTLLDRIDPAIMENFQETTTQVPSYGIKVVAPNDKILKVPFKRPYDIDTDPPPGFVSKRLDFDNFLIEEVKKKKHIQLIEGIGIESYEKLPDGYRLKSKDGGLDIKTTMLFAADGAYSKFSKKVLGIPKEPKHYAGAVRAYYQNVEHMDEHNFIELHYIKDFVPGYFWIFPLPNGEANVGAGMLSHLVQKKKVNLREKMVEIIENYEPVKERFKNAKLVGGIKGFGLPLGSRRHKIYGDHFMVLGDAAHLIDPFTGEGIGNAMYSGVIAAEQMQKCIAAKNYSEAFLKDYYTRVFRVLGQELMIGYQLQRIARYPALFNTFANFAFRNEKLVDVMTSMFTDIDLRKKLANPMFLLKMMLNR